jgi:DNA-binding transcriptional regulator YdaS (Cro superfamily)
LQVNISFAILKPNVYIINMNRKESTIETDLTEALAYFGNAPRLARALGVKPQAVYNWIYRSGIPIEQAIRIERITGGRVKCSKLLPVTLAGVSVKH